MDANKCKEEGNAAFKNGELNLAIKCYTKAIELAKDDTFDKAIYYKNRAAAHLKKERYEDALEDCTSSLRITPNDPKALFRRCQALEALDRLEEAYRDARQAHTVDPGNKALEPILKRLHEVVQERLKQNALTENKISQMLSYISDPSMDDEKRETAMNNLLVLSRGYAEAEVMMKTGVVEKLAQVLKSGKAKLAITLAGIRTVSELCKKSDGNTVLILRTLGVPWFLDMLNSDADEQVNSAQYCIQTVLNSLIGSSGPGSKPNPDTINNHKQLLDTIMSCLVYGCTSRSITGLARDAIIELITRNADYKVLEWCEQLVEIKGIQRLLEVSSEIPECLYESAMQVTDNTKTLVSICLQMVFENMYYDLAKERFLNNVDEFVKEKLLAPDIESKVRVVVSLTTLLLGPLDIGNTILGREGVLQMILVMAGTDDPLQQRVACECIVAASSKKDKAQTIIAQGISILKKLYQSKDKGVRVRALVGLCKLGSTGGTDASIRPFADGSTAKLAEACRHFLTSKDKDSRRWAVEGLSYLTLDADVKEKFIQDRVALRAMIDLGKAGDQSVVFGVVTTLVNLCNAYEKKEVVPEMIELAKFAKHHIPEEHELDDPDFIAKRVQVLGREGVTSALVALSKAESLNSKELISRVLNALCGETDLRGLVVQQGGVKALLTMALEGTDRGKRHAAQALARIGISLDPKVAFPGQRILEVIRPLLALLHMECSALENFESLLALCNLAGVSETVRSHILKEGGIQKVETYMYEEHEMLRRAATQVMTNMAMSPEVVKIYEGENDRTKFLVLLCGEEDSDTREAAAGALAMLTSVSKKICMKVVDTSSWLDSIHMLLGDTKLSVRLRGTAIVASLLNASKEVAEKVVDTNLTEIMMALAQLDIGGGEEGEKIQRIAADGLKYAEEWNLLKKSGDDEQQE